MALPRILQKLFQNGGAGPRLLNAIMPEGVVFSVNGSAPDGSGNVAVATGDAMEADILSAADKAVDGTVTNVGSVDVANLVSAVASVEAGLEAQIRVVETWSNGTEWYRVWSDGLIEQGASNVSIKQAQMTINFNKPFTDTSYQILTEVSGVSSSAYGEGVSVSEKSTTGFTCHGYHSTATTAVTADWYARGY